jgi:LSD1 subclass zinc finger protein
MVRVSSIRCPACSAPLHAPHGQEFVTCGYCHATSHVSKTKAGPPPKGTGAPAAPATKRGGTAAIVASLIGMAVVGGAGYVFLGPGVGSTSTLFAEWYTVACPVDANGDDVIDFAGRVGRPGMSPHRIAVIDGIDGSILWTSEAKHGWESWVMCLGQNQFAVAQPDFRLDLYDARGGEPKALTLADRPLQYGSADGCLQIHLADGSTVGVRLPSGERGDCDAVLTHQVTGGPVRDTANPILEVDGTTYAAVPKEQGTPTLTIQAEGAARWSVPLRYAAIDRSRPALAVTPSTVVTYGIAPGNSDEGVLVGLDRTDGTARFEIAQRNRWSAKVSSDLVYNGRYVVMGWGFGLHAYDPETGDRVWKIGGRR